MAIGTVGSLLGGANITVRSCILLSGATGVTGQPALPTDGCPRGGSVSDKAQADVGYDYPGKPAAVSTIAIQGAGGTTATFRLWGYIPALAQWVPVGATPAGDSLKGTLNNGVAIGQSKAGLVLHSEPILYTGHFSRLYLEVVAVTGTFTSIDAVIISPFRNTY